MTKSRLWIASVAAAAMLTVPAVPALADGNRGQPSPIVGEQVMALNVDPATNANAYGCEEISWFGTVELYGRKYGMALYPISGGVEPDGLYHYEEGWKIFVGRFSVQDGELRSCTPGRVLASGTDVGAGVASGGYFESQGAVDSASGRLKSWVGKTVIQDGHAPVPVSVARLKDVPGLIGELRLEHVPANAEQVMALNIDLATDANVYGCEEISWFGTVELYGKEYGMALYPISGGVDPDDGLFHYEEGWKIFSGTFRVRDGQLRHCSPGRVLASGTDVGVWDLTTKYFESQGTVESASSRFKSWVGKTVVQDGYAVQPVSVARLENVPGLIGALQIEP